MTAREALHVRNAVVACTRCVPCKDGPLGMEMVRGGQAAKLAMVVPEPTTKDLADQRLFRDAGGNLFRSYVNKLFSPEEVVYVPVQGCQGSTANCRSHLEAQLFALDSLSMVVLVGKAGLDAWRPDQTLTKQAGNVGRLLDKWPCMPVLNPDSCVRGYADKKDLGEQIANARALVDGHLPWDFYKMFDCPVGKCVNEASEWDPDGVGYCGKHWKSYGGTWKKARKEWVNMKVLGTQPRLSL